METLRLVLADDHLEVLNYLTTRLKREPQIEVVGQATNSAQAVALSISQAPDVIIIDPVMRDGRGFDALNQITRRCPSAVIVVLTAIADTAMRIELGKLGVHHIITKGTETTQIIGTLSALGAKTS